MRVTFRKVAYSILGIYIVLSCYTSLYFIRKRMRLRIEHHKLQKIRELTAFVSEDDSDWNPWGEEFDKEEDNTKKVAHAIPNLLNGKLPPSLLTNATAPHVVEIWGKAAIGLYLWEHIFNAPLERKMQGVWSYGEKKFNNVIFKFRTGPGVVPEKVPKETKHLILVLNGRNQEKIEFSKSWLDSLSLLPHLQNIGMVLLGDEHCNNEWLMPYMEKNGGRVQFTFLIYDSPDIDNHNFFQWPLGVATYRDFPKVKSTYLPTEPRRQYLCNFLGTVYKNSSRETLMTVLNSSYIAQSCFVKARHRWLPSETDSSRGLYIRALSESDLTLNPVGINTECYRIYEAMSYGSVPVLEDVMTPGNCGKSAISSAVPLRLLKEEKAPVIYVKDWKELRVILEKESAMSEEDKAARRKKIILWYEAFKIKMRDRFVRVIEQRFFNINR